VHTATNSVVAINLILCYCRKVDVLPDINEFGHVDVVPASDAPVVPGKPLSFRIRCGGTMWYWKVGTLAHLKLPSLKSDAQEKCQWGRDRGEDPQKPWPQGWLTQETCNYIRGIFEDAENAQPDGQSTDVSVDWGSVLLLYSTEKKDDATVFEFEPCSVTPGD
jgi:hypothetical protein